jgi:hydroxymethylpyrimidine pyrophosphatase-like HAD family hydrolase
MKLTVLAVDYDGTIARDDQVDPRTRAAIAALRSSGVTVLLVTGRTLSELRRVAGDLHFVDGVVAENGALVHFPDTDYSTVLAPLIPEAFYAEVGRRGIPFQRGQCLVDAAADDSPRLLDVIRALELPLVPIFNRSRVMIVPQGVSKAIGLQSALAILRLSPRNTLAIGDAENDHELLRLAEVGAAVAWGSASLKAAADLVVPEAGAASIADFISPLVASQSLPQPGWARRRLRLGYGEDGTEFSLAVRGRNVLIAGDAKSGKSWVAGLLCEQLILHGYSVCVIDPEGDYRSLEALPGVSVLGGEDPPPSPRHLLRALRYPDRSIVIDLSRLPQDEKIEYARAVLPLLNEIRARTGLPHRILIDEAHYFLHEASAHDLLDMELNGYTVVTYWASRLPQDVLAAAEVMIVTCESDPAEVEALWRRCSGCSQGDLFDWRQRLGHVPLGQAVALPITEEAGGTIRLFTIGRRLTPHVRHRQKYVDVPVSEHRAFVFGQNGKGPWRRARTLRQFVEEIERSGSAALAPYLLRNDFSRWIGEVFGDHALASDLHRLETRYHSGRSGDVVPELAAAVRGRYDLTA